MTKVAAANAVGGACNMELLQATAACHDTNRTPAPEYFYIAPQWQERPSNECQFCVYSVSEWCYRLLASDVNRLWNFLSRAQQEQLTNTKYADFLCLRVALLCTHKWLQARVQLNCIIKPLQQDASVFAHARTGISSIEQVAN